MRTSSGLTAAIQPAEVIPRMKAAVAFSLLVVVSIEAGRFVADGKVREVSLLVVVLSASLAAQLSPTGLLAVTIAVSPLPLFMQGLGTSLTPGLVFGLWIAILFSATRGRAASPNRGSRYPLALSLLLVTTLVAVLRGPGSDLSRDLGALANLAVGVAIFLACLVVIDDERKVRLGWVSVAAGGLVVFAVSVIQLLLPSVLVPGLLTPVGTVQTDLYGIARNLRVGGPIGDYELLGELFGLVGTVILYLGLSSVGPRRAAWLALVPVCFVGIVMTSTRSGLVLLVLGAGTLVAVKRGSGRLMTAAYGAALVMLMLPLIRILQSRFGTGFLFERLGALDSTGGFRNLLGRGEVWQQFTSNLPGGADLVLGTGPSFDFAFYATYPHSLPLTLVFTVGILGAIAFYGFLATILVRCIRTWRASKDPYAFTGGLLVLLFVINEFKIEYLRAYNYQWFIWAMLGVSAASSMALRRESR